MARHEHIDTIHSFEKTLRERVAQTLGVGHVETDLVLAERIEAGVPVNAVATLVDRGVPEGLIFENILPRRTYQRRREHQERLNVQESTQAERFVRLLEIATIVFGDRDRATQWLSKPKRQFSNRAPLALSRTGVGADVVERALLQSYFGFGA